MPPTTHSDDPQATPPRRKQPDPVLLAVTWGALWGVALGLWLLAPAIVNVHFVHPRSGSQWLAVTASLSAIFAIMGAFLSFFASFVLVVKESRGRFRDRTWAYALAVGPLVVTAYVVDSLLIHWKNFHSFRTLWMYGFGALVLAGTVVAVSLLFSRVYARATRVRPAWLALGLSVLALAGLLSLPFRTMAAPRPVPPVGQLVPSAGHGAEPPLLFIGLDSGTWRVLEPLIASGAAPHLRALWDSGIHGDVEALWPPHWSGAAWAAIVTGHPRDVTGVYEDLAAQGPGLPFFQVPIASNIVLNPFYTARYLLMASGAIRFTPPPRALLNGQPFWELLHGAGVPTAVVRFRFTYPATGADIVVSDWVGRDQWQSMGVRREPAADAVAPRELTRELLAPFTDDEGFGETLISELLPGPPGPRPADAANDPVLALRWAADIDRRTLDVSEVILKKDPKRSVLAIYLDGFDLIAHAFWQYRFPEDFHDNKPAPADVERLRPVIDRYVRYLDARVGRLLALYATKPDVLIVSDHGHGPTTIDSSWRGWHWSPGMFLMGGPQVPYRANRVRVSYYDVLPTVLDLKRLHHPTGLRGTSVLTRTEE
jgi:hypothetical protein